MIKHNNFNHLITKLCLSKFKYIENKRASADRDIDLISSDALLVSQMALSSIYAYSARVSRVIFKTNLVLVHELHYNFKLCIRNSSTKLKVEFTIFSLTSTRYQFVSFQTSECNFVTASCKLG